MYVISFVIVHILCFFQVLYFLQTGSALILPHHKCVIHTSVKCFLDSINLRSAVADWYVFEFIGVCTTFSTTGYTCVLTDFRVGIVCGCTRASTQMRSLDFSLFNF